MIEMLKNYRKQANKNTKQPNQDRFGDEMENYRIAKETI